MLKQIQTTTTTNKSVHKMLTSHNISRCYNTRVLWWYGASRP